MFVFFLVGLFYAFPDWNSSVCVVFLYPLSAGECGLAMFSISIYPEDERDKRRVCHRYLYIIYIYAWMLPRGWYL